MPGERAPKAVRLGNRVWIQSHIGHRIMRKETPHHWKGRLQAFAGSDSTDPHINYIAEFRCLCWLLSIFLPILGFLLFLANSSFSGFKWYKASSTGNNPALVAPLSLPHHFPSVVTVPAMRPNFREESFTSWTSKRNACSSPSIQLNERWQHICESALQFSEVQSNTATQVLLGLLVCLFFLFLLGLLLFKWTMVSIYIYICTCI